jgi:hypothetical protein
LIPYVRKKDVPIDVLKDSMRVYFQLADYVDEIDIHGGETLLYPQLSEAITELSRYSEQFGHMRIVTNATLLPKKDVIDSLKALTCKYKVRISDYGKLSTKSHDLIELLKSEKINYDVAPYTEDEQYFGGWVYLGDLSDRGYSEQEISKIYARCNPNEVDVYDGKIFGACGRGMAYADYLERHGEKTDYLDLFSDEPIEIKQEKLRKLAFEPTVACQHCNGTGYGESAIRVPAAQQLTADEIKEIRLRLES